MKPVLLVAVASNEDVMSLGAINSYDHQVHTFSDLGLCTFLRVRPQSSALFSSVCPKMETLLFATPLPTSSFAIYKFPL